MYHTPKDPWRIIVQVCSIFPSIHVEEPEKYERINVAFEF